MAPPTATAKPRRSNSTVLQPNKLLPSQPPSTAPPMPIRLVMTQPIRLFPPGSLPGKRNLATAPATRPNSAQNRKLTNMIQSSDDRPRRAEHGGIPGPFGRTPADVAESGASHP